MPIRIPKSDVGLEVIQQYVPQLLQRRRGEGKAAGGGPPLEIGGQHEVYSANLKDAASGHVLDRAKRVGWEYLLLENDNAIATAQVDGTEPDHVEFSHVNYGQMARSAMKALQVADSLDAVQSKEYELRVLQVPPLYLAALWLTGSSDEIVIPLEPAPPGLKPNRPYTREEFERTVEDAALKNVSQRAALSADDDANRAQRGKRAGLLERDAGRREMVSLPSRKTTRTPGKHGSGSSRRSTAKKSRKR